MKTLKRIIPSVIVLLIFGFLIRNLVANWQQIPFEELRFNGWYIALAFLMLVVHFLSYSKSWQEIMSSLGHRISYTQSFWIIATTQIAKYLPGRIWYMVGRVYVGKKEKLDGKRLALSMILETCLLIITCGILFLVATLFTGVFKSLYVVFSAVLIAITLVILHPRVLSIIVNFVLRILKREPIEISITYDRIIRISIYFFGLWLAQIIGFYCLVSSFYPINITCIPLFAAAYCLSWITGFVVLIAPSGLGIREGVMTLMLSSTITTPLAIVVSFISRIWFTIFELVVFFVGLLIRRWSGHQKTRDNLD